MNLFIEYPTCSTCKKAKKFLKEHGMEIQTRHIVEQTPNVEELTQWYHKSSLKLGKFFNTSGALYRSMHLKDTIAKMSEEEQIALLASNGMLIKRPLLITDTHVLVGFQEDNYRKVCAEQ